MTDRHGLTRDNMLTALPLVLQEDEGMAALAASAAAVLEKRRGEIQNIAIYPRIDELPGELLDILAKDFKIDWWDNAYSLETKRALLKDCWNTHRILGTRGAVVRTLCTLYGYFDIREWWEYGGEPGNFQVQTRSFPLICELDRFLGALATVKRLSARLEKIDVLTDVHQTVGVGLAEKTAMVCTHAMEDYDLDALAAVLTDDDGTVLTDENNEILTE